MHQQVRRVELLELRYTAQLGAILGATRRNSGRNSAQFSDARLLPPTADALFQPQQHPARDEHDTFFIKTPAATLDVPKDYMERVRATHEDGGASLGPDYSADSRGWRYDWSEDESRKNLLRTHTTAVSSRTLYQIAQLAKENGGKFKPQKYFSIDRVFRNEALDATHLAEFHQARDAPPALATTPPPPAACPI